VTGTPLVGEGVNEMYVESSSRVLAAIAALIAVLGAAAVLVMAG